MFGIHNHNLFSFIAMSSMQWARRWSSRQENTDDTLDTVCETISDRMTGPAFVGSAALLLRRKVDRSYRPSRTSPHERNTRSTRSLSMSTASSVNAGRTITKLYGNAFLEFSDGLNFQSRAEKYREEGLIPPLSMQILTGWFDSYAAAVRRSEAVDGDGQEFSDRAFSTLMELMRRQVENPIAFESFHRSVHSPFDYYKFAVEFSTVLLNATNSRVDGQENLHRARAQLAEGDNVVFLSNHQSEGDPYAIDGLLCNVVGFEREFCKNWVFMAGDRVREDLVVVPFSVGRNLLTVYSKKHLDDVPELRAEKVAHNRRTISVTQKILQEGGKCIWFAPSGGRDRRSKETGRVEVSPFDSGAIEMMRFTANKSGRPCHFYPMSLVTYNMLPPPSNVGGAQVGEERVVNHIPMFMAVGDEIDWSKAVPSQITGKIEKREAQGAYVQSVVIEGYKQIGGYDL